MADTVVQTELQEVQDLLTEMVRIPSVTVRPGDDGPGEQRLSRWIAGWLRDQGMEVATQEAKPGRDNVIARIPGRDRSKTLVMNSHLDTVEVEGMSVDPFGAEVVNGRLYGRGSCDAKGCLTTFMLAAKRTARAPEPPPIDVVFLATIGEESGGHGIRAFTESLPADHGIAGCLIGEPTELRAVIAHKGGAHLDITTQGKAAHSSQPWQGDNAIYRMAPVLQFIENTLAPELESKRHPLVGPPSMAVTGIRGGIGANVIPPSCTIGLSRRTIPGEDPAEILADLKGRIEALDPGHIEVVAGGGVTGLHTPAESPLAQSMKRALEANHLDGTGIGVNYGTDGLVVAPLGIPVVVFGPGSIDVAHQADESVPLQELVTAARVVTDLVRDFDG
ncbi:MAG: M20 family metallopeptidase [Candidatus Dormibacteraceae bacterium]